MKLIVMIVPCPSTRYLFKMHYFFFFPLGENTPLFRQPLLAVVLSSTAVCGVAAATR
jgi:hypothetical protein